LSTPSTQLGASPVVPLLLDPPLLPPPLLLDASPVVPLLLDPPLLLDASPVVPLLVLASPVLVPVLVLVTPPLLLSPLVSVTPTVVPLAESSVVCVVVVPTVVVVVVAGPPVLVSVPLKVLSVLVAPVPRPRPAESKLHAPSTTHPTNQARAIPISIKDHGVPHESGPRACPREPRSGRAPRTFQRVTNDPRCSAQCREFVLLEGAIGESALAPAWIRRRHAAVLRTRVEVREP
jgi:hypothetical protein